MIQILRFLLAYFFVSEQQKAIHDLHRKPVKKEFGLNRTFILLTLALTLFFVLLFVLMLTGMSGTESGQYYNQMRC